MARNTVIAVAGVLLLFALALLAVGPGRYVDPVQEQRLAAEQAAAARQSTTTTIRSTTTSTTGAAVGDLIAEEELETAAATVLGAPTEAGVAGLARSMAATGDTKWVPYLIDLRLLANDQAFGEITNALETLTGVAAPPDPGAAYLAYGQWMYSNEIDSGESYVRWKAQLFTLIDPLMGTLVLAVEDPILAGQLQWGGVPVGGIPELNDQSTLTPAEADHMLADELTFGAVVNGVARAYPHRILDHHELANDTLGGEPVALVNCTLCRTGVLYSRTVDGQVLDFITSGLLHNSNKVMMDRQTQSLWFQLSGEAITGELKGTVLDRHPVTVSLYGDWVGQHPDTDVVSIPTGFAYSYAPGDAYATYYGTPDLWFPTYDAPDVFEPKAEVATVDLEGTQLAVEVAALVAAGPSVIDAGEHVLVAIPTPVGARFYRVPEDDAALLDSAELAGLIDVATVGEEAMVVDGKRWDRVVSGQSFWFAWYGNYPTTVWWPTVA